MRYEFNLDDYWNIMDEIRERSDVEERGFAQIKIDDSENGELYVYGYRIFIPELNLTAREGIEYYTDDDGDEQPVDSYILYKGDERDPLKYTDSYCNTFLPSLIGMIADNKKLNTNPKCVIDDTEFVFWEND